jgi:hypothetical protein
MTGDRIHPAPSRAGVRYVWEVTPDAETPLTPGCYTIQIFEGGTYRNLASRRKYTVRDIDRHTGEATYEYTRGDGEHVTRTDPAVYLAVVEAVGDTPPALLDTPDDAGGDQ